MQYGAPKGHLAKSTDNVNISKYMTESTYSEARLGIFDEFPILEVSHFPSAKYHPSQSCPLVNTPNMLYHRPSPGA